MNKALEIITDLHNKISKEKWSDEKAKGQVLFGINLCMTKISALLEDEKSGSNFKGD